MLFREIFFICFGYLLGSILFARLFGLLFAHKDITQNTADGNPGTANAFLQGGFLCGVCTLLGDLFKGYLPVAWYLSTQNQPTVPPLAFALLIAAPVLGHIFPLFHHLHGGKGIATSFGCLLALLPDPVPVLTLAFSSSSFPASSAFPLIFTGPSSPTCAPLLHCVFLTSAFRCVWDSF